VTARVTLGTAARVLRQPRRDPRTIALVLVVPVVMLTLFRFVFDGQPGAFDRIGPPLVGIFPLISMFLVTSIAMLRERSTGTLERLMSMPIGKLDLLIGYGLAFVLVALVQATGDIHDWVMLGLPLEPLYTGDADVPEHDAPVRT
jgi:ABC-2 type transport system permease protein